MIPEKTKNHRNCSVEVLRCLLMFLIVLFHNWLHGIYGGQRSVGPVVWWTVIFTGLIIWHVDGFLAISGWYGIRFTIAKWLKLFAQALCYSVLNFAYLAVFSPNELPSLASLAFERFPCVVNAGWFGASYMMLMLVAPLVDGAIQVRREKGDGNLFFAAIVIGMTCAWAPQHAFTGIYPYGFGDCTFLTMLYVYFIMQYLHQEFSGGGIPGKWLVAVVALYPIMACAAFFGWWGWCNMKAMPVTMDILNTYWNYTSPPVISCAVAMVILFAEHIRMPHWLGSMAQFLGPSMFGVYLIHDVCKFGKFYVQLQQWLVAVCDPHPLLVLFVSAAVTFAVCLLIDLVRRALFWVVENKIWRKPRIGASPPKITKRQSGAYALTQDKCGP